MPNYLTDEIIYNILSDCGNKASLNKKQKDAIVEFNKEMPEHKDSLAIGISTLERIQFLIAIVLGETSFNVIDEKFTYSENFIRKKWGSLFVNESIDFYKVKVQPGHPDYEKQASRLANKVYGHHGNDKSNTPIDPFDSDTIDYTTSDGWKFRGSGYIQLTGRYNFKKYSKYVDTPDMVREVTGGVWSACRYATVRTGGSRKKTICQYADEYTIDSFIQACKCVGEYGSDNDYKTKRDFLKACQKYITSASTGLNASASPFSWDGNDKLTVNTETNSRELFLSNLYPPGSNVFLDALYHK